MDDIFSTRDLYLSSVLVTLKFPILGIDFVIEGDKNRPIGFFKFKNTQELQDTKSQYSQGMLLVEPKIFITNLKSLKSDISGLYNNPHTNPPR